VPLLRVWQLSQQAVSGMLAGLLKQPRRRSRVPLPPDLPASEDPRALKRRIAELERRLRNTEDLVRVLRTAPWVQPERMEKTDARRGRKRPAKKARTTAPPRDAAAGRSPAPEPTAQP